MMDSLDETTILLVEHVVWSPGSDWHDAIQHIADRFARTQHPLDANRVLAADGLAAQVTALDDWAHAAGADADRELGRWFDEHLSMHVRPDPSITRAVRARAASGPLHAASALGARSAESLLRHTGCWRSISSLHSNVRSSAELERLGPIIVQHRDQLTPSS